MESDSSTATLPENISSAVAEKLKALTPGTYCTHRSWGFGQIKDWDVANDSVTIDFKTKKGHLMQFVYAAESLTPLPGDHILVQKAEGIDGLKQKAQTDPVTIVADSIRSLGATATADNIQAVLSPDVISAADYKKWWEGAKRAMKKNGLFYVPGKKTEALRQLEAANAMGDSAMEHLRLANGPKAVLAALASVSKYWSELKGESALNEVAEILDSTLGKVPKSQLAMQVELALARDEFLMMAGRDRESGPRAVIALAPAAAPALSTLLDQLPSSRQGRFARSFPRRPARGVAQSLHRVAAARQRPRCGGS